MGDLAEPADADAAARAFAAGMLEELNRIEEAAIAQAVGAPASSFRGPYAAPPWGVSAFAGPVVHGNLVESAVWPWDEPTPVNAALWRIWGE